MKTCDVRNPALSIIETLNEFQPAMIGSYPTALELLVPEQEAGNLHVHPAIIMTGGEYLSEDVRKRLSHAFGCYVQTNYSCTEGGIVACECTEHHFHINDDWVILEAVDENNRPVPLGTQSSKVLLTNLANKICPIIRFEITDRIVMGSGSCPCGNSKPWLTLEGRTDDILTFENGIKIPPLSLYAILKEVHGIRRFQLVQTAYNRLELRLIADDRQAAFAQARQALKNYLNQNGVSAELLLSEKIPEASPISGKYKHIIAKQG
ncbi:MAG: phenylacetate--CoA ligase family protein [Clostridiales bacterium]|nr:phenylacetate--CoA ligase family protein [Clostridiales bacterium]